MDEFPALDFLYTFDKHLNDGDMLKENTFFVKVNSIEPLIFLHLYIRILTSIWKKSARNAALKYRNIAMARYERHSNFIAT